MPRAARPRRARRPRRGRVDTAEARGGSTTSGSTCPRPGVIGDRERGSAARVQSAGTRGPPSGCSRHTGSCPRDGMVGAEAEDGARQRLTASCPSRIAATLRTISQLAPESGGPRKRVKLRSTPLRQQLDERDTPFACAVRPKGPVSKSQPPAGATTLTPWVSRPGCRGAVWPGRTGTCGLPRRVTIPRRS
jgi:hypothetical protein